MPVYLEYEIILSTNWSSLRFLSINKKYKLNCLLGQNDVENIVQNEENCTGPKEFIHNKQVNCS